MGDLNLGPGVPSLDIFEVWPATWDLIIMDGWTSANTQDSDNPLCTFCPSTNLLNFGNAFGDRIIDHILVKNAETSEPSLLFNEPVQFEFPTQTIISHLSDHYGY